MRRLIGWTFAVAIALAVLGVVHPQSPLPDHLNPVAPFTASEPAGPFKDYKLSRALAEPAGCAALLAEVAEARRLPPLDGGDACGIPDQVELMSLEAARTGAVATSCETALRTGLWMRHGVQPAARRLLGTEVTMLRNVGSYSCRRMRTSAGDSGRMSSHATASAIDIVGFDLSDGRRIRLLADWKGGDAEAAFLRAVRDAACDWFPLVLSPDYNALHADHFHLQATGWGLCR